uniref:Uncharacterized protein n=1 Tax=Globisporangium ultimum (strain ATCC 200006 / CBS 805.95 / DAOM BR144) TaxID=431595 RepID=K3WCE6_GLOUD
MKRPELHRFHSNAIAFAKSLCSFRVISRLTHTLDRVARLLKVAGGGRKDSPHALASILCVILSFLTNCLHSGDSATQHWVHTDLIKILLSHAKANALVFVNVVDSNVLNTIFFQQQRRRLVAHSGEQHANWKVFTTTTNSTGVSPFKLLLVKVIARAAHSN